MCCGNVLRSHSQPAKQFDAPVQQQSVRQSDTGNPVNVRVENSSNITRANEVKRNQYHQQHFGGR